MSQPLFTCPRCGSTDVEPGFVDDATQGRIRWFHGPLEFGPMGNSRRMGRRKLPVLAARCRNCSRLELYAPDEEG